MIKYSDSLEKRKDQVDNLVMKALKKVKEYELSEYVFVREYQEDLIQYVEEVFTKIVEGIALDLNVDPSTIKKSQRIPLPSLMKVANGDEGDEIIIYKSIFNKLRNKLKWVKAFMKKYKWNKGKPLEPIRFKGMIKYNPVTKKPLTNQEWKRITNSITDFLKGRIGNIDEELIVRSALFGKLIQMMESEGLKEKDIKKKKWNDIVTKYGDVPNNLEEATKKFKLDNQERYNIEYAQQYAGEHLAIPDGKIRNGIIDATKQIITEGLKNGDTPSQMVSSFYHVDDDEELKPFAKLKNKKSWDRNWRRVAITESKTAQQNGYLLAHKTKAPEEKQYFIFDGSYSQSDGPGMSCNKFLGEVCLLVDEPLGDDRIKDPYAKYAIWPGKNNVGRKKANHWVCIPMHPHCTHKWTKVDPTIQEWDSDINKIVFKEVA